MSDELARVDDIETQICSHYIHILDGFLMITKPNRAKKNRLNFQHNGHTNKLIKYNRKAKQLT